MSDELAVATDGDAEAGDVPISTLGEATARADRIRAGLVTVARLQTDIATAYQRRDWTQLGYGSWDAYVAGEFGDHRVKLSRPQRQEIVAKLRGEGMSTRAIGAALGIDQRTVRRDLPLVAGDADPGQVVGVDGKRYAPANAPQEAAAVAVVLASSLEPAVPRRRPLAAEAAEAAATLEAALSRWDAVTADTRFAAQRARIAEAHAETLGHAAEVLARFTG